MFRRPAPELQVAVDERDLEGDLRWHSTAIRGTEAVRRAMSALRGLKVLDFTRVLAGPLATMLLGDFGAEVTKVERPGTGDDTRGWAPPRAPNGEATYFQAVNRNKSSIVLDLAEDEDASHARALAREADVVVENFRPGLMARYGLDEDRLRLDNPQVIYCSITGFGHGAGAQIPAYDLIVQALGGLMSVTGSPLHEPQRVGVAIVDVVSGLFAAVGILAALHHRSKTGRGQRVDVDLLMASLAALVNQASAYTSGGVVAGRVGNRHPSIAPYEVLPTGGGDLVIAVGTDRQFAALCRELGLADLAADPRFQHNSARVHHADELRAALIPQLACKSAAEWTAQLTRARVPVGVVNDIAAAFQLAQTLGLEPTVDVPAEGGAAVTLVRNPIRLSLTPAEYISAPPALPR